MPFLKKIQELEIKIDQFLDITSTTGILFESLLKCYLQGQFAECEGKARQIKENERSSDVLRIHVEKYVYSNTIIPENRGDVLALLEMTDNVIDQLKEITIDMVIERPFIPEVLHHDLLEMVADTATCVDEMVKALRAFFYNVHEVTNYVNKVLFYEKEVDILAEKLKTELYLSDLSLAEKNHIKYYVKGIEKISDLSQDVSDRLIIYTMKREL